MPLKQPEVRKARRRRRPAGVTIHDVAKRAGVSVATVSRVLNGKEVVREETSQQVFSAAKSLRYVPNVAARSLSIRRSQTIGILLPDVHGEFFSEIIRGIDVAARAAGYHILVSGWHSDTTEMLEMVNTMRGRVDGLVVMAPDVTAAALRELSAQIPVVILNASDDEHDAITIDNYGGAKAMMRHLIEAGHTQIAFVKGPPQNNDARERLRGYRQAMRATKIEPLEIDGDFSERSGFDAARRVLETSPRPTAVFTANDSMAIGLLSALTESAVDVPRDIAVAGFDDIPIAHYVAPPLTTVRVDIADLGRRSFTLLLDRMSKTGTRAPRHERVETSLVVRASTTDQKK